MKAIERLYKYLEYKKIKPTVFEKQAGISSGYLSKQFGRVADIGESILVQITENCPDMSPEWLLLGTGDMLKKDLSPVTTSPSININCIDENFVRIPLVDISVAAGSGFYNGDCLNEVEVISLPRSMVKDGKTYLCVRAKGRSMEPSILDGGHLVIRMLERSEWENIRDNYVYVVSDTDGRAYVKRLKNRLCQHGFVVCMSDNADKQNYSNFNLYEEELNTIWYVEWYFTAKIPNIQDTYYHKQAELEDRFDALESQFQQFTKAISLNINKSSINQNTI